MHTHSRKKQHTLSHSSIYFFFLTWGQNDAQGGWPGLRCLSGLGWSWPCADEVPVLPSSRCSAQELMSPLKCSALTCPGSWGSATVSSHPLTTSLLEIYPGPHNSAAKSLLSVSPEFKFTCDLTQWLLQRVSGKRSGRLRQTVQLHLSLELPQRGVGWLLRVRNNTSLSWD